MTLTAEQVSKLEELNFILQKTNNFGNYYIKYYKSNGVIYNGMVIVYEDGKVSNRAKNCPQAQHDLAELRKVGLE